MLRVKIEVLASTPNDEALLYTRLYFEFQAVLEQQLVKLARAERPVARLSVLVVVAQHDSVFCTPTATTAAAAVAAATVKGQGKKSVGNYRDTKDQ
ncbi:Hypothetical protein UVM_LOCUS36 [uncultured virus]|nr:Hypothetical protein UVM_LOCUS36 [uncultured virus]